MPSTRMSAVASSVRTKYKVFFLHCMAFRQNVLPPFPQQLLSYLALSQCPACLLRLLFLHTWLTPWGSMCFTLLHPTGKPQLCTTACVARYARINNSPRPLINTFCHQHCFLLRHSYLLIKVKKRQNVPNSLNLKCRTHCKTPLQNKNDSLLQIISMATHREISVQSRESSALERDLAPPLSLLLLLFLLPTTYLPSLPPIPSYPSVELSSFCMLINIPPLRSFLHMLIL